jgi:hypothetical protein
VKTIAILGSVALIGLSALPACTAGEGAPSTGKVTLQFPSTQAAVGTDFVQLLVFDLTPDDDRGAICLDKITARKRKEPLGESAVLPPWNVCELNAGRPPVTVGYGEKAILAIAQRTDANRELQDFLIGCAVQTIGNGDAPLPIYLSLIDVGSPVPETNCATVSDWCGERCQ